MKQFNKPKGAKGEEIAGEYLAKKGFKILDRNYRTKFGEIDLIATHEGKLIFIEVKLKVGDRFGTPEEMITRGKISQVKRTAQMYLLSNKPIADKFDELRIDAVCIILDSDGSVVRIAHYENLE